MRAPAARRGAVCVAVIALMSSEALAQAGPGIGPSDLQERRGETVRSRARPEYDPLGLRAGGFVVRPGLTEELGYNDNVLGSNTNREESFQAITSGEVGAGSTWERHQFGFGADFQDYRFFSVTQQNYTNWAAGLGGRYDIQRNWRAFASYRHSVLHELPDDPDSVGAVTPLQYTTDVARLVTRYTFNRLYVQPAAFYIGYRYDDADFVRGRVSQAYRDRDVYLGRFEVGYEFAPGRAVFGGVQGYRSEYINAPPPGSPGFDSNTYEVFGGIDYDADGVWNYRVSIGARNRSYDDGERDDVAGLALDAIVTWRPSAITTVSGVASTAIEDGATPGDGGYRDNRAAITIDHEYLRNVILSARGGVRYLDYVTQDRDTITLTGTLAVSYLVNRNVRIGASYERTDRFADRDGDEFDRNLMLVRLRLAL